MKNILFGDDDTFFRFVLSAIIGRRLRDCQVLPASNGTEEIHILNSQPVHFVLTDICMDGMDGFQLAEYMNTYHPEIPVAVMSADGGSKKKERRRDLGVSRFFEKPSISETFRLSYRMCSRTDYRTGAPYICRLQTGGGS